MQKGDVLLNINGEELTFKNKFELISKLSSLGGTAEVNVLRKTSEHHHSSSLLTSSNYCFASSKKTLSASNNNISSASKITSSNSNDNNLNSTTTANLKTSSDQGPIIIPYHNGIFAQNSIKLAMRKYEKPAIKSNSDIDSNLTLNNTNTLTSNNENSNLTNTNVTNGTNEALNVPSNASCYHINTEILNEVEEKETSQEHEKTKNDDDEDPMDQNKTAKNCVDNDVQEEEEDEENCLLSSIHSDNWLLLIDNANSNTHTKCSVLNPEMPDLSHQQTCTYSSSSSPASNNKHLNNLATAPHTLTSSSCHSERSLVKLNCPVSIFYDEQQQIQSKQNQNMLVSSLLSSTDCLDNQEEVSKSLFKSVNSESNSLNNNSLPSVKQYVSTCQIEIKSCTPTQHVAYQLKPKINVKNAPVLSIKSLKNEKENVEKDPFEDEEDEQGLKSSLTSITTTNTVANNALATGGAALNTLTIPFYTHTIIGNSNRKENSENDCDQDQLDDVDVDLIDSNCYW